MKSRKSITAKHQKTKYGSIQEREWLITPKQRLMTSRKCIVDKTKTIDYRYNSDKLLLMKSGKWWKYIKHTNDKSQLLHYGSFSAAADSRSAPATCDENTKAQNKSKLILKIMDILLQLLQAKLNINKTKHM